jgi:hypothetical protein
LTDAHHEHRLPNGMVVVPLTRSRIVVSEKLIRSDAKNQEDWSTRTAGG